MTATTADTDREKCACLLSLAEYVADYLVDDWYTASEVEEWVVVDPHNRTTLLNADDELWIIDLDGLWSIQREMDVLEAACRGQLYAKVGDHMRSVLCAYLKSVSCAAPGQ